MENNNNEPTQQTNMFYEKASYFKYMKILVFRLGKHGPEKLW